MKDFFAYFRGKRRSRENGGLSLLHMAIIGLSLMMTVGAWLHAKQQTDTRVENAFKAARDQAIGLIVERMGKYEEALWAGVSAIQSHGGDITHGQWRTFANALRIDERFPGINGIGVIHHVEPPQFGSYLEARRAERAGFTVFPPHDQEVRLPISFIEPEWANAAAVGLDVAHEVNRREAALASRATGLAQITGPIVLVQDESSTPGFLFYAPYYAGGGAAGQAEREERFLGVVYAPFVVRKLMEGLLAKELRDVRFSISDGGQTIYNEHDPADPLHDASPLFEEKVSLELYGRDWLVDVRSNLGFRRANTYSQPVLILIGGLVIETLVIALLVFLSRANKRAKAYADRVTADLRQETAKLAKANEELEQFAYITSHDLKTPVRGIGLLTEMVQEDLEEYFRSPEADPGVAGSLEQILQRVHRMNDLIDGVMEYSRIGTYAAGGEALDLDKAVAALRSDFALAEGQLELHGGVSRITADAFNFRRVLENLVGNAVKYHPAPERARISVSVRDAGDRYAVSVKDDGAGIDPAFHNKIFDVFQTLRRGDQPESTGIGLAIVKKSVERHGFRVTVTSAPGEGAEFAFDWPKNDATQTRADREIAA
ncbi:sensor histidine kinase [Roseobacteraceae bacterium NS-SX3]